MPDNVAVVSLVKPRSDLGKRAERNVSLMSITLCLISFISRITSISCGTYFFIQGGVDNITFILITVSELTKMLGPFCSFFVFFLFNQIFRKSLRKLLPSLSFMRPKSIGQSVNSK
jgi:hypothetical protein